MDVQIREFQARDVFVAVRIMSKVGLKEFKGLLAHENMAALVEAAGGDDADGAELVHRVGVGVVLDVADLLLANIGKVETDLCAWLGDLSSIEDVAALPAGEFVQLLEAVVESDGFSDFFREASGWLARAQASSSPRFTAISTTQGA